ncbi:transcriptional regulator [Candidatus Saccharibacteria bacterium]|nr:transcriptional regulator [Candidatus Saccharibacteria bacterium]
MSKENSTPTEKLFGSKTRAKLLQLFFENPERSFYVREITRVIEEQINSVRRELINLESIAVIKNETFDNKIYYSANSKHPYYRALTEIFSRRINVAASQDKETIVESAWEENAQSVKNYLRALLVTNRRPGQDGIDVLIVGDDRTKKLTRWAEVMEKKQGRPLNYVILSVEDFAYRKSVRDRFIMDILEMEVHEMIDPERIIRGKEKQ